MAVLNTIKSISERVLRILNKGDVPQETRFIMRDITYAVRDNLGKQILASWYAARNSKEAVDISDAFISTIQRTVQTDANGICFIELDFDWVDLPDDTGIQSIRPSVLGLLPDTTGFIPLPARFNDIYRGLPAKSLEGQVGFQVRGKRAYFTDKNGQNLIALSVPTVLVDAITTVEETLGQEKPLPISPNLADAITREVVAYFAPFMDIPKDMLLDQNSNIKPIAP